MCRDSGQLPRSLAFWTTAAKLVRKRLLRRRLYRSYADRSEWNPALSSQVKAFGYSQAAKWPPLSSLL